MSDRSTGSLAKGRCEDTRGSRNSQDVLVSGQNPAHESTIAVHGSLGAHLSIQG
jgi:hypothetical protein